MRDFLGYSLYLPVIWLETGILSPKVQVDGLPLWGVFTHSPQHTNKCKEKERDFYRGTYFYFIIVQLLIFTTVDTARLPLLWFLMSCFQKLQQNNSTSKNGPYYLNPEKNLKIINILMYDVMLQSWSFGTAWWGLLFFDYSAHSLYTSRTQKYVWKSFFFFFKCLYSKYQRLLIKMSTFNDYFNFWNNFQVL